MKTEIKGWIGKTSKIKDMYRVAYPGRPEALYIIDAVKYKGAKSEWAPEDWPPKRIRITIEEITEENTTG